MEFEWSGWGYWCAEFKVITLQTKTNEDVDKENKIDNKSFLNILKKKCFLIFSKKKLIFMILAFEETENTSLKI